MAALGASAAQEHAGATPDRCSGYSLVATGDQEQWYARQVRRAGDPRLRPSLARE